MKKRLVLLGTILMMQIGVAHAADNTYVGMKAGVFLPNGKEQGLKLVNTGYDFDVAVGVRPAPYAAIEVGTGFFTASGKSDAQNVAQEMTAYGVPVTLTAKGTIQFDKVDLYAGAGAGLYFCFIDNKVGNINESQHGTAPGYHAVAGGDLRINDRWSAGAEFKWFSTRPELTIRNPQGPGEKEKWEFGGTTLNVGLKYNF